jgi:hypothetical protein
MSKRVTLNTLLVETDVEQLLRGAHKMKSATLVKWWTNDENKFDQFIYKVGRAIKRNKKLVTKIRGEK